MSNLIIPKGKSVLTPEKEYEARYKSAEIMRDTLFVGAIMGMAETVHQSGEYTQLWNRIPGPTEEPYKRAVFGHTVNISTSKEATEEIMRILALCYENKWNVAVEMLNWKKNYIADKIKEKIRGEQTEGIQTNPSAALSEADTNDSSREDLVPGLS